jgi:hypothetical protein
MLNFSKKGLLALVLLLSAGIPGMVKAMYSGQYGQSKQNVVLKTQLYVNGQWIDKDVQGIRPEIMNQVLGNVGNWVQWSPMSNRNVFYRTMGVQQFQQPVQQPIVQPPVSQPSGYGIYNQDPSFFSVSLEPVQPVQPVQQQAYQLVQQNVVFRTQKLDGYEWKNSQLVDKWTDINHADVDKDINPSIKKQILENVGTWMLWEDNFGRYRTGAEPVYQPVRPQPVLPQGHYTSSQAPIVSEPMKPQPTKEYLEQQERQELFKFLVERKKVGTSNVPGGSWFLSIDFAINRHITLAFIDKVDNKYASDPESLRRAILEATEEAIKVTKASLSGNKTMKFTSSGIASSLGQSNIVQRIGREENYNGIMWNNSNLFSLQRNIVIELGRKGVYVSLFSLPWEYVAHTTLNNVSVGAQVPQFQFSVADTGIRLHHPKSRVGEIIKF